MSASGFTDWLKIPSHVSTFSVFAVENISWSGGHGKLLYHDSYSIKMFGALDYRWVATVWGPELAWCSNYLLPGVATADSTVGTSIVRLYFLWKCSLFSFLSFVFLRKYEILIIGQSKFLTKCLQKMYWSILYCTDFTRALIFSKQLTYSSKFS